MGQISVFISLILQILAPPGKRASLYILKRFPANVASLARSKPTTTSPSIRVTGVVHVPQLLQFVQSIGVNSDVSFGEINLVLRKKLFRPVTKHSTRLAVKYNLLGHLRTSQVLLEIGH